MCQRSYKNLGDRVLSSSEEISSKLLKVDFGSVSFPLRQSLSVRVVILWLAAILLQLFLFLRTALKSFFKFDFANLTRIIYIVVFGNVNINLSANPPFLSRKLYLG